MVTSSSASSASIAARASSSSFSLSGRHRQRTAPRLGQGTAPGADRAARRRARAVPRPGATPAEVQRSVPASSGAGGARRGVARSANRRCTSSSAESRPSLPSIAPPRPARIAGSGSHWPSSRSSRGQSPARRNDDLPAPEAPRMTSRRGSLRDASPRSASMPRSDIGAAPKNTAASSGSSASSPR